MGEFFHTQLDDLNRRVASSQVESLVPTKTNYNLPLYGRSRQQWAYPDTQVWDAARNTREFLAVDWTINIDRKRGFFQLLQKITTGQ